MVTMTLTPLDFLFLGFYSCLSLLLERISLNPEVGSWFVTIICFCSVSDPEAEYIGTEPWKPKEALEKDGIITDKADIFSFGLTLWEMMTLSIPHLNLLGEDDDGASKYS